MLKPPRLKIQAHQLLGGEKEHRKEGLRKALEGEEIKKKVGKGEGNTEEKMGQEVRERNAETEEDRAPGRKDPRQACVSPQIKPPLWRLGLMSPRVWSVSSQDVCLPLKLLGKAWAPGGTA